MEVARFEKDIGTKIVRVLGFTHETIFVQQNDCKGIGSTRKFCHLPLTGSFGMYVSAHTYRSGMPWDHPWAFSRRARAGPFGQRCRFGRPCTARVVTVRWRCRSLQFGSPLTPPGFSPRLDKGPGSFASFRVLGPSDQAKGTSIPGEAWAPPRPPGGTRQAPLTETAARSPPAVREQ